MTAHRIFIRTRQESRRQRNVDSPQALAGVTPERNSNMKRIIFSVSALILALALFGACSRTSGNSPQPPGSFVPGVTEMGFTVNQRTDYGDEVRDFVYKYNYSQSEPDTLEVLQPEVLRGLKATLGGAGNTLEYDGMMFSGMELPGTGMSPLEVMPFLIDQWKNGYMMDKVSEKLDGVPCTRIVYRTTQNGVKVDHNAWFTENGNTPVKAELLFDGILAVTCRFEY